MQNSVVMDKVEKLQAEAAELPEEEAEAKSRL
jgi:hypothetical protein